MRIGGALSIVSALALGSFAVLAARGAMTGAPPPPDPARVVVAKTRLAFGQHVGAAQLQAIPWAAGALPPGAFSSVEQVLEGGERVVLRTIDPFEPILADKLSGPGGRAILSALVSPEMRAITIRVDDVLGVAGFVLPGDRVDVLATRQTTTDILLQNVRVLGVDQDASDRKDKPAVARAVTLEVTPRDAQKLTLAGRNGTLSLALRNLADAAHAPARTVRLEDLSAAPARPAAPGGMAVAVVRGMKTDLVRVASPR